MATIWCDFHSWRCISPNRWLVATNQLPRRNITSKSGALLICLENLRTLVEFDDTLCFHLADIYRYRGKIFSQPWLQLPAIIFCRQAKIRFLDQHSYTFENPVTVLAALSVVKDWSCTNMGIRPLLRTVWKDRKAILEHLPPSQENQNTFTGKL